jgi:hypothetical protein
MSNLLEQLCIDMRALGIKSLALELSDFPSSPPSQATDDARSDDDARERATLAPEIKDPSLCRESGCGEKAGGLFGGAASGAWCRKHALIRSGVRA